MPPSAPLYSCLERVGGGGGSKEFIKRSEHSWFRWAAGGAAGVALALVGLGLGLGLGRGTGPDAALCSQKPRLHISLIDN